MNRVKRVGRRTGMGMIAASFLAASLLSASVTALAAEEESEEAVRTETAQTSGEGFSMSTAYPGITALAGETVTFDLNFASLDGNAYDADLSVVSIPEGWEGYFQGGDSQISRVHIDDQSALAESALAEFSLTLPEDAEEGSYDIELSADDGDGNASTLALEVTVGQVEVGQSTFTSEYPEQQGATGTTFTFDMTIVNNRSTDQSYSLSAETPSGWQATFTPSGESTNVASLNVEAGSSQGVTVTITPPESVETGDYTIPCSAISADDSLTADLLVTITGTYGVELSTPTGNLSLDAEANQEKAVTLSITNTGNVDLANLNLTSSAPTDWEVRFDSSTIDTLEAGATQEITAYITPAENAITGDYVTSLTISNDEVSDTAEFRVSVQTPTTWGIVAICIIVVLVAALAYIFKKYGRR
ncbi:MAG TPA: hypothetical protein IAB31_13310 [Candidatus Choladousia intestinavium]|uniref:Alpha-galactosidase NEW3 domain-containing protein n=1 Tax=Candidatus Choladousia intestinavium TaxID=2840727 RepID=A0A9D1AGE1_9FIRM|nr:hypothetical protein [Candidatus Choladousia intestinavium]